MLTDEVPQWLRWAREIQALTQSGLAFSENDYQRERYQRLSDIAAEVMASHTLHPVETYKQLFLIQPGYATPKVDVRGAAFQDGKLLLVREAIDSGWCLPGGWADVGEIPSKMVEREVLEESGFEVKACKVIGVYDANRGGRPLAAYHAYKVIMLCEIIGGEARPSKETTGVAFFGPDEIPEPLSTARTSRAQITDAFAHLSDPLRPAAFD